MPSLYISEYSQEGVDALGRVTPVAKAPATTTQKVTISGTSAQSSALDATTTLVRVHTDATCSILFGADPTATASNMRMAADQTEYFAVPANSGLKIAVITNS